MSLFYTTVRDAGGHMTGGTTIDENQLTAMWKRDSTADYQVKQLRKIKDSYSNPSDYFEQKAQAMSNASTEAAEIFAAEYAKHVKNMVPSATALVRARKLASAFQQAQEEAIEDDFPSDMSKISLRLMAGRGEMANNGFSNPDSALAPVAAPKRGRKSRK